MSLGKQAKTLSKGQIDAVLGYLNKTRHPIRNRVIFLLSIRAGLRAKEIASLTWSMVTDPEGNLDSAIRLENAASKGRTGGRVIPMSSDLREVLKAFQYKLERTGASEYVIATERAPRTCPQVIVNLFSRWYRELGFNGCSSHSGRRTFITNAARKISSVGGSLRDVQMLAGHSNLATTQRYIEANGIAQQRVVEII
jgi:integrase/recombinase XerD